MAQHCTSKLDPEYYNWNEPAAKRWISIYSTDFLPVGSRDYSDNLERGYCSAPVRRAVSPNIKTETGQNYRPMFQNWKVPSRLTDGPPTERGSVCSSAREMTPKRSAIPPTPRTSRSPRAQLSPRKQSPTRKSNTQFPTLNGLSASPRGHSALAPCSARIAGPKAACPPSASPAPAPATPGFQPGAAPNGLATLHMKKAVRTKQGKADEAVGVFYRPAGKLDEWLAGRSQRERQLIERTLRLTAPQPDGVAAEKKLDKWLCNSSDSEKGAALEFFASLTGTKLLGDASVEQRQRVTSLIHKLQSKQPARSFPRAAEPIKQQKLQTQQQLQAEELENDLDDPAGSPRLQHVRLLTPYTRANRWMFQTWHHLPANPDTTGVPNNSSMYTQPHKPVPAHFSIHPDWG